MSGRPIKPSDVARRKAGTIPGEVFDAFNDLIALAWNGREAVVRQADAVAAIMVRRQDVTREEVYARRWLDVEEAYREAGWVVVYDRPGYCETYEATFTFRKRRR